VSLEKTRGQQKDGLLNDGKSVGELENLLLQAKKTQEQVAQKQSEVEKNQAKRINSMHKKQTILWELSQNESVDARSDMSQVLSQLLAGRAGQIPRRQINLEDALDGENPHQRFKIPEQLQIREEPGRPVGPEPQPRYQTEDPQQ